MYAPKLGRPFRPPILEQPVPVVGHEVEVHRISLVFREMWDTANLHVQLFI